MDKENLYTIELDLSKVNKNKRIYNNKLIESIDTNIKLDLNNCNNINNSILEELKDLKLTEFKDYKFEDRIDTARYYLQLGHGIFDNDTCGIIVEEANKEMEKFINEKIQKETSGG